MENRCPSPQLVYEYILKVRGTHKLFGYPQTQAYPSSAFLQYGGGRPGKWELLIGIASVAAGTPQ